MFQWILCLQIGTSLRYIVSWKWPVSDHECRAWGTGPFTWVSGDCKECPDLQYITVGQTQHYILSSIILLNLPPHTTTCADSKCTGTGTISELWQCYQHYQHVINTLCTTKSVAPERQAMRDPGCTQAGDWLLNHTHEPKWCQLGLIAVVGDRHKRAAADGGWVAEGEEK